MLTSAQICTEARSVAKCSGYTTQSGRALNLVLEDLTLHRQLKVNRFTETLSITAGSNGPFNLSADYLRTYDLFFVLNNMPFFLRPLGTDEYDALFKSAAIANYPFCYMTDLQPQAATPDTGLALLYIYPQSTGAISMTHRYMLRRAAITTPESATAIPWFQDQDYLIQATAMRLMRITDDSRYDKFVADCDKMLLTHLLTEGDEQEVVKEVQLDPKRFRFRGHLKSTKTEPF